MLKTEHKNVKIYSLYKNDEMMNVFFLFIYHQEECNGRKRHIADKFQYWYFLFLPQISVLFLTELFLIKNL